MREIVLIDISGRDRPGITMGLTDVLARYQVTILDIGQSVIHNTLALGLLVELPDDSGGCPVFRDLLFKAHELGLDLRFTPIDPECLRDVGAGARPAAAHRHAARARDQRRPHRPRIGGGDALRPQHRADHAPVRAHLAARAGPAPPPSNLPRSEASTPAFSCGCAGRCRTSAPCTRAFSPWARTWTWTSPSRKTTSSAATAGWSASTWTRP